VCKGADSLSYMLRATFSVGAMDPIKHYSRVEVAREVVEFLRGRWAALEGPGKKWVRWRGDRPLKVDRVEDVTRFVREYRVLGVRTFYGTIEVFRRLEEARDVEEGYEENILKVTPFIDIDIVDEAYLDKAWPYVVKIAEVIVDWLCREGGVCESVYLLWSGAGMHVRVNENAFSKELLEKHHPLDIAFAFVEYTLSKLETKILQLIRECKGLVKVENLVAPKRVFTAPLSLHRKLDRVAVTLTPDQLGEFSLDWSNPENPVHNPSAWRRYRVGEADELALKAIESIGRVKKRTLMDARATKLRLPELIVEAKAAVSQPREPIEVVGEPREPGRFQVMALLQAARYYLIMGDLEKAKSWGLNRAIFYAWAKYYGPSQQPWRYRLDRLLHRPKLVEGKTEKKCPEGFKEVLGECVQVSSRGWFVIGGQEQTPLDFEKQVKMKVQKVLSWDLVWKAALDYVSKFPEWVLKNPQKFYKFVYEPIRDTFFKTLLENGRVEPPRKLLERLESLDKAYESIRRRQTSLTSFTSRKSSNE